VDIVDSIRMPFRNHSSLRLKTALKSRPKNKLLLNLERGSHLQPPCFRAGTVRRLQRSARTVQSERDCPSSRQTPARRRGHPDYILRLGCGLRVSLPQQSHSQEWSIVETYRFNRSVVNIFQPPRERGLGP